MQMKVRTINNLIKVNSRSQGDDQLHKTQRWSVYIDSFWQAANRESLAFFLDKLISWSKCVLSFSVNQLTEELTHRFSTYSVIWILNQYILPDTFPMSSRAAHSSSLSLEEAQNQPQAPHSLHHHTAPVPGEKVLSEAVSVYCRAGRVLLLPVAVRDPGQDLVPKPAS